MRLHQYTVVEGDNLWSIAERQLGGGSQWSRIWLYNNRPGIRENYGIPDPDLIYVGQVLLIPPRSGHRTIEDSHPPHNLKPARHRGHGHGHVAKKSSLLSTLRIRTS
jgi:LysM repeat protein